MITDEELFKKIDEISANYVGQLDDLYSIIGMIVMGRFYGWRVVRLVSTRRLWKRANDIFGDVKLLMPERGAYANKSLGLKMVDELDRYWDTVNGLFNIPLEQRKGIL